MKHENPQFQPLFLGGALALSVVFAHTPGSWNEAHLVTEYTSLPLALMVLTSLLPTMWQTLKPREFTFSVAFGSRRGDER